MESKRTRLIAIAGGVMALAAAVVGSIARDSRDRVSVVTERAVRTDLVATVSAFGAVRPRRAVDVGANVSGRIVELPVKEGQPVKRGQVLARIESEEFEAAARHSEEAAQAAQAELKRAQAELEVSLLNLERLESLHQSRLLSREQYDQAQGDVKMKAAVVAAARHRVGQLQATLDSQRNQLRKTVVASPIDGVVISLPLDEGEVVIGAQSFSPTVLMTVADPSVMEVEVRVDESDIRNVALGQAAAVRVDALEGVEIDGEVTEIGSSAMARGATGAGAATHQAKDFKVVVTLKDPPPSLRPGVNATADITTARRKQALAVPVQAIVVRQVNTAGKVTDPGTVQAAEGATPAAVPREAEKDGVFVVAKGEAVFRPVETGILGDTRIEVVAGLNEGEEVVTGSYKTLRTLKDKARVKVGRKKEGSS